MYHEDEREKIHVYLTRGSGKTFILTDAILKAILKCKEQQEWKRWTEEYFTTQPAVIKEWQFYPIELSKHEINIKVNKKDLMALLEE